MAVMASEPLPPRTVPENVTMAPISVRPAVRRDTSAPTSKSSRSTRTATAQPPVTGGKKAISRAPSRSALGLTCLRSSAVRITSERAKASAYSGPRSLSQHTSSATVFTSAGTSRISSALPVFSRTHAKYRIFTGIPGALVLHGRADGGLEVVIAGPQRQQRCHPKHDEPGPCHARHELVAGRACQQDAKRDHLHRRLPLGELRHMHPDIELGQELTQTRDQDLAAQNDNGGSHMSVADGVVVGEHQDRRAHE